MDDVDHRIVRLLVANARATFLEIGDQVGLSASAAKRRFDKLVESGAVRGFTAQVDPRVLGWRTEAYVEVYCKGTVSPVELQRSLEGIPEVVGACTVTGAADACCTSWPRTSRTWRTLWNGSGWSATSITQ